MMNPDYPFVFNSFVGAASAAIGGRVNITVIAAEAAPTGWAVA
jgi:hypothetical protein